MPRIDMLLTRARELGASDIHIAAGSPPMVRHLGRIKPVARKVLSNQEVNAALVEILSDHQRQALEEDQSVDLAYQIPGIGRFRVNVFRQSRGLNGVFRVISENLPSLASLGLPDEVRSLTQHHQGLVLVTGPTGQGKTSTLAALVRHINENLSRHVLTVEDPIEFVHPRGKSLVAQRQVNQHTMSFASAVRAALREDPDVIVIGELRDAETITNALTAAETGHLVFGTLMTSSAHKTVDRIIDSYPSAQQAQVRTMLSETLKAILCQKLVPNAEASGLALATELLICTRPVSNLIREAKTFQIPTVLQTGRALGMHRLEDSLKKLVVAGEISKEEAMRYANEPKLLAEALGTPTTTTGMKRVGGT